MGRKTRESNDALNDEEMLEAIEAAGVVINDIVGNSNAITKRYNRCINLGKISEGSTASTSGGGRSKVIKKGKDAWQEPRVKRLPGEAPKGYDQGAWTLAKNFESGAEFYRSQCFTPVPVMCNEIQIMMQNDKKIQDDENLKRQEHRLVEKMIVYFWQNWEIYGLENDRLGNAFRTFIGYEVWDSLRETIVSQAKLKLLEEHIKANPLQFKTVDRSKPIRPRKPHVYGSGIAKAQEYIRRKNESSPSIDNEDS